MLIWFLFRAKWNAEATDRKSLNMYAIIYICIRFHRHVFLRHFCRFSNRTISLFVVTLIRDWRVFIVASSNNIFIWNVCTLRCISFYLLICLMKWQNIDIQLFKGSMHYCEGPDVSAVRNKSDCLTSGSQYRWVNRKYNFDNLGQVSLRFLHLCTTFYRLHGPVKYLMKITRVFLIKIPLSVWHLISTVELFYLYCILGEYMIN